jgi:hypothetical protein
MQGAILCNVPPLQMCSVRLANARTSPSFIDFGLSRLKEQWKLMRS